MVTVREALKIVAVLTVSCSFIALGSWIQQQNELTDEEIAEKRRKLFLNLHDFDRPKFK